jgi:hypothetical protein
MLLLILTVAALVVLVVVLAAALGPTDNAVAVASYDAIGETAKAAQQAAQAAQVAAAGLSRVATLYAVIALVIVLALLALVAWLVYRLNQRATLAAPPRIAQRRPPQLNQPQEPTALQIPSGWWVSDEPANLDPWSFTNDNDNQN